MNDKNLRLLYFLGAYLGAAVLLAVALKLSHGPSSLVLLF